MTAWRIAVLLFTSIACGCASVDSGPGPAIDTRHLTVTPDSRVQFLILHYTVADFHTSMEILTQQEVSAHYLLGDEVYPAQQ